MPYSNAEVAQRFKEGKIRGKSHNMFIAGDSIYSYGWHFPIAKRIGPGEYLFNTESRSMSTSKHQAAVSWALRHDETWAAPGTDVDRTDSFYAREAKTLHEQILVARSLLNFYTERLVELKENWERTKKRFGIVSEETDFLFLFTTKEEIKGLAIAEKLREASRQAA